MRLPGAAPVAILNYGFWERRYGKDPAIVGRTVRMNGAPTTVIGVMPQGFSFPQKLDLWVPLVPTPKVLKRENRDTWMAFGRMADGVTIESARAEMETIGKRLAIAYPLTNRDILPAGAEFPRVLHRPKRRPAVRVHVGRGWFCAVDRLRQSGESHAGSRDRQIPRNFRPHRTRRGALANHSATPDRERDAFGAGRRPSAGGLPNGACAPTSSRWRTSRPG